MTEDRPQTVVGDTNIFIALLSGPAHLFHEDALAIFRRVAEGHLAVVLTAVVVAELAYVAGPVLGWSRNDAASGLTRLLMADGIVVSERDTLVAAMELYAGHAKLDFADAYVAATALRADHAVATFDRGLEAVTGLEVLST